MYQYFEERSWTIFFEAVCTDTMGHFTITPDETTDVSTEKQLGICVVYFNEKPVRPVTRFFDMVVVEQSTANRPLRSNQKLLGR